MFQNKMAFPLWLCSFGHVWMQHWHSDAERNNHLIAWEEDGLGSIPFKTLERLVCSENTTDPAAGTNNPDMFCPATRAKNIACQYGQYGLLPLYIACFCSAQPLFHYFFFNFSVFVCGVQHLGACVSICRNINEAFHLILLLLLAWRCPIKDIKKALQRCVLLPASQ